MPVGLSRDQSWRLDCINFGENRPLCALSRMQSGNFPHQLTRSPEESPPNLWVHLLPRNNEAIKLSGRKGEVGFKNDGDIARRIE